MMARSILAILLLFLAAIPGAAAETFKGEVSGVYYPDGKDIEAMPAIDYRVNWKAWSLLGEPVVDANITWNFKGREMITVRRSDGDWTPMQLDFLPAEGTQLIRIYDAKLRLNIQMEDSIHSAILEVDLGVPSQAGGPASYNTPVSFSWDTLLMNTSISVGRGDYLSADDAKAYFKNGFYVVSHEVVLKYDVADFRAFLSERFSTRALAALDRAATRYIRAIEKIFKLNTFPIEQRHAVIKREAGAAMYDFKPGALDAYKAFVDKLAGGVPPEFRIPSRIDTFEAELDAIGAEYKQDMLAVTNRSAGGAFAKWEAAKRSEIAERGALGAGAPEELLGKYEFYRGRSSVRVFYTYMGKYGEGITDVCMSDCTLTVYEDGRWHLYEGHSSGAFAANGSLDGEYEYDGEALSGSFYQRDLDESCVVTGKFYHRGADKYGELYEFILYTEYKERHPWAAGDCNRGGGRTGSMMGRRLQE